MQKALLAATCLVAVGLTVYLSAQPQNDRVKIRLRLVDAATGKGVTGIVRVFDADKKPVEMPGLFNRMAGLTKDLPGVRWYIVPADGIEATLPRGKLQLEALSGLETTLAKQELDLSGKTSNEVAIKLNYLFRADEMGLVAGNTHLHLRYFSKELSDEYLRKIPAADGLRVMFISYLERDKDDLTYITNKYPIGNLDLGDTGVLFNNGEEHRHNFTAYGEGYGHVMFLNIKQLVKPVSIGQGITGAGNDDLALRAGIDNARAQGGTVIWCHNNNGFEDVPNAVTGRLDALNLWDGSRGGKYEDAYYRYLNIGLKMPLSTGTDWFMYDVARVYARVNGKLTVASWLDAVKAGRCQVTNGPILTLTVDGKTMGDVIDLKEPKTLKIHASAIGRHPVQKLQLIRNGQVIKTQTASAKDPSIQLTHEARIEEPAWFAVRIDSDAKNEFNKTLYAHTSPIYINYQGKSVFNVEAAVELLKQVEEGQATIKTRGNFSTPEASRKLLAIYDEAATNLRDRINARRP